MRCRETRGQKETGFQVEKASNVQFKSLKFILEAMRSSCSRTDTWGRGGRGKAKGLSLGKEGRACPLGSPQG